MAVLCTRCIRLTQSKRVLGIGCGDDEKEIGIEQVEETVQHIIYYSEMKKQILEHCII